MNTRRHPAGDRRPRPGRPVQLADHPRRQPRAGASSRRKARRCVWFASGRRGVSSLTFRGFDVDGAYVGFTDRPAYCERARHRGRPGPAYVDGKVDRVEVFYNDYVSPLTQEVRHERCCRFSSGYLGGRRGGGRGRARREGRGRRTAAERRWLYEPDPEEILARLVPDYVEITIYRALLESTASEHGARMTAMRNASENATEIDRRSHARDEPPAPG